MGVSGISYNCSVNIKAPAPNPDPSRWVLIEKLQYTNAYVLKVKYKDCTNFEGIKIMVYKGQYRHKEYLDPHFQELTKGPIARFEPSREGYEMAIKLAKSL